VATSKSPTIKLRREEPKPSSEPATARNPGFLQAGKPEGEIDMKIDETLEMAYPQKLARDIIIGIADQINENAYGDVSGLTALSQPGII
jgi:hypothetical protein